MLKTIFRAATVAVLASLPLAANALTFTVLNSSTNNVGNQAHVFGFGYGTALPSGSFWTAPPETITPPPANLGGVFLSPWANTPFGDGILPDRAYYSVQSPPALGSNPAKLSFSTPTSMFRMLWGSIDDYNEIAFFDSSISTTSAVASWKGDIVAAQAFGLFGSASGCDNTNPNLECVAEVVFSGSNFDRIEFASKGANAFEFATVPLPAAAWLLLGVSGALVAAKRRSSRKAA